MAYNALNNLIDAYIYANGVQAITGQILNGVLKQMVSQLGSGYHLMGVANPETVPEQNDYAMAYFAATAGEYTDFGGITLAAGEVAVLLTYGNGSWSKQTIYTVPTTTEDLENTANFITNAVTDLVNYYTKTEVDDTLANYPTLEALATALADYYTKQEVDTTLDDYATKDGVDETLEDYYTKDEVDAELADRYTKQETDTKLGDYYKKTETYDKDEVDSIVAALSRQEYIVAWDGLAAPDVSAIPAGVTVTYSSTTYTGTLAASASTVNKIYMVWNGVAYDMYGTSQDGGYSWVPMGTTTVDLSQYATKEEVGQLQQKLTELPFLSFRELDFIGTTGVEKKFRVIPGHKYRMYFLNSWSVANVSGSNKFSLSKSTSESGTYTDVFALTLPQEVPEYHDFTADTPYYRLWGRGDVGEVLNLSFQDITVIESKIAPIEDEVFYVNTVDVNATICFEDWAYGYVNPYGTVQPASSGTWKYSDKIPIVPDTPIVVKKMYCNTAVASIAAYNENDIFIAECSLSQSAEISESNPVTIQTTGKGVAYIRISAGGGYASYDVTVTQYSGVVTIKEVISEIQEQIDGIGVGTQWSGKSWVALGTSITDTKNTMAPDGTTTGKFLPYLVALSGLVVTDKGVAGAVIGGHILYYAGHTSQTATADIVTIEGGVNDWVDSRPLGQVGDTVPYLVEWTAPEWNNGGSADGTFAGACYQAIKTAMDNSPKALVVVITDNTGQYYAPLGSHCEREKQNSIGLLQKDYTDMLIAVAHYMGVPVINAGQKSMVNQNNPEYLIDQIHQTELGGEQFANTIWSELKNFPCRITE